MSFTLNDRWCAKFICQIYWSEAVTILIKRIFEEVMHDIRDAL